MATPAAKSGELVALPRPPGPRWRHRHTLLIGGLAAALVATIGIAVDVSRRASLTNCLPWSSLPRSPAAASWGTVRAAGTLVPAQVTLVAQAIAGRLTQVSVKPGEQVSKGQILARFDPLALRAELALAEARVVGAEVAALESDLELVQRGLRCSDTGGLFQPGEDDELDGPDAVVMARGARAAAEVAASDAAYRLARQRHAQGIVRAPQAGVVLQRKGIEGELLAAGAPLFLLAPDPVTLQLEVAIPEAASGAIAVGQPVEFTVPAFPGRRFAGNVQRLLPFTGPETARKLPAIVATTEPSTILRVGMTASVVIRTSSDRSVVRVPSAALTFSPRGTAQDREEPAVWVVGKGTQELRQVGVQLGITDGAFAEFSGAGLAEGHAVAVGYAATR